MFRDLSARYPAPHPGPVTCHGPGVVASATENNCRLAEVCESLEIGVVDPRDELRRAEETRAPAYYVHDAHWNGVGNRTAAEVLRPAVREVLACGNGSPAP